MNKFLKGNVPGNNKKGKKQAKKTVSVTRIFEDKALKELGGSIAFVMKSNKFLWGEDEKAK